LAQKNSEKPTQNLRRKTTNDLGKMKLRTGKYKKYPAEAV